MSSTPDFVNRVFVLHLPSGGSSNKSLDIQIHAKPGKGVSRADKINCKVSYQSTLFGCMGILQNCASTRQDSSWLHLMPELRILSGSATVIFARHLVCHSTNYLCTCCADFKPATSTHGDSDSSTLVAQASVQLAGQALDKAGQLSTCHLQPIEYCKQWLANTSVVCLLRVISRVVSCRMHHHLASAHLAPLLGASPACLKPKTVQLPFKSSLW